MSKAFSRERLGLERLARLRVKSLLEAYGCKVLIDEIPEDVSLTDIVSYEVKRVLSTLLKTKYDLFVVRTKTGENYLCEVKGKSREEYKGWVNCVDYDAYYRIASMPFPFLYFVLIRETDKIYRHTVVDPSGFETDVDSCGKPIYKIPSSLFNEVKPDWAKRVDVWCSFRSLERYILSKP